MNTNWWNIPLIDMNTNCGMPICPCSQSDKLVWLGTTNGHFLVRSAYHHAKEKSISERGMCSSFVNLDRL
jgi:hypothetical protein